MKTKVVLSAAIIILGAVATVAIGGIEESAACHHSEGIVIDYGSYDTVWMGVDFAEETDPVELLKRACEKNNATPTFEDGKLIEIIRDDDKTISNDSDHEWGLWYINKGGHDFKKSENYRINASDYNVVSWAYTVDGEKPTVAVDALGTSIYGYSQPGSVVTLSPLCAEIVASMNKESIITGREKSSDYPESIKNVSVVGTYTGPSYESIMSVKHDIVFCDGSVQAQREMARILRDSNVNSVVIYDAKTLRDVINNIFIVGTVTASDDRNAVINDINRILDDIKDKTRATEGYKTLVTLGFDPSPYVAGKYTYIDDLLIDANGSNAVGSGGWLKIAPEKLMEINPDCIIVIGSSGGYKERYEEMKGLLPLAWKATNAFKNDNMHLFAGKLGEKTQIAGPRIAQFAEILAKKVNPYAFKDNAPIPNGT